MIAAKHLRFCAERGQLLEVLTSAARDYADVSRQLLEEVDRCAPRDFKQKRRLAQSALNAVHHAREALLEHRKEHGC